MGDKYFGDYDDQVTNLKEMESNYIPPTNDAALVSFLAGVAGWFLAAAAICPISQYVGGLCAVPLAFVAWAIALFAGFHAKGRILESGEGGAELARWGLISSVSGILLTSIALSVLLVVVALGFFGAFSAGW